MNFRYWIRASLAVFVVYMVLDFILHSFILSSYYRAQPNLWRPEMMSTMWIMQLSLLVMSFLFVFIFAKGYEGKGLAEGLRFGLIMGAFYSLPHIMGQYVVYPIPLSLALGWLAGGIVEFLACGLVAAAIYKAK